MGKKRAYRVSKNHGYVKDSHNSQLKKYVVIVLWLNKKIMVNRDATLLHLRQYKITKL